MTRLAPRIGAALLCIALWGAIAQAYPVYDDGAGNGCVSCHNGFQGGNGPLHFQHRTLLGITTCNLCHPSGGGTTPVRTYTSGPGGGFGCAGCHGQDYGETSPNSGLPKATGYGLRRVHVSKGVTSCGTSGCHRPGALGQSDPFPEPLGEDVAPPYYNPIFSSLMNSCSSQEEDMPFDADSVGLDNDGDGLVDAMDPDCAEVSTTTTTSTTTSTTTTTIFGCAPAPAVDCIAAGKAVVLVNEKTAGKQKVKVALSKLQTSVEPSQFGDPVTGTTRYAACLYGGTGELRGEYTVARAGEICGSLSCWATMSDTGYKYADKTGAADGILKMRLSGGDPGKAKLQVLGKNTAATMPIGVASSLQDQPGATVQFLTSDGSCFTTDRMRVKKADGKVFSAVAP
jgi:hypothetical protein